MIERGKNSKLYQKLKEQFKEDDIFWNNEIVANMFVSIYLMILAVVLFIAYFFTLDGVLDIPSGNYVSNDQLTPVLCFNLPILLFSVALCHGLKGNGKWLKYLLCIASLLTSIALCSTMSMFVSLIICIPVLLSTRYYSYKFTLFVSILSVIGMFISEIFFSQSPMIDLNLMPVTLDSVLHITKEGLREAILNAGTNRNAYLIYLFKGSFLPRFIFFSVISMICIGLTKRAHEMVIEQDAISKKNENIETELNMATKIQTATLPKTFPAFDHRPELDLFSMTKPAKEVGGDFYDYYLLDDTHLLIMIADVSGKGIPAALFMMKAKTLIKTYADIYSTPVDIAREVNKQLCDQNDMEMFVTAWIGVFDLENEIVMAVDAGHEYPYVKHIDGSYEIIKGKKSFVLAGMETAKFHEYSFEFHKGDTIFLYTDGIPEATNNNEELYGMKRLDKVLDQNKDLDPKSLIYKVEEDVTKFVDGAIQSDDLTMVSLHYKELR